MGFHPRGGQHSAEIPASTLAKACWLENVYLPYMGRESGSIPGEAGPGWDPAGAAALPTGRNRGWVVGVPPMSLARVRRASEQSASGPG